MLGELTVMFGIGGFGSFGLDQKRRVWFLQKELVDQKRLDPATIPREGRQREVGVALLVSVVVISLQL